MKYMSLKSCLLISAILSTTLCASTKSTLEEHFIALREIKTHTVTSENNIEIVRLALKILEAKYVDAAEKYVSLKALQDLCLDKMQDFIEQNPSSIRIAFDYWRRMLERCNAMLKIEAIDDSAGSNPVPCDWSQINGDRS